MIWLSQVQCSFNLGVFFISISIIYFVLCMYFSGALYVIKSESGHSYLPWWGCRIHMIWCDMITSCSRFLYFRSFVYFILFRIHLVLCMYFSDLLYVIKSHSLVFILIFFLWSRLVILIIIIQLPILHCEPHLHIFYGFRLTSWVHVGNN